MKEIVVFKGVEREENVLIIEHNSLLEKLEENPITITYGILIDIHNKFIYTTLKASD